MKQTSQQITKSIFQLLLYIGAVFVIAALHPSVEHSAETATPSSLRAEQPVAIATSEQTNNSAPSNTAASVQKKHTVETLSPKYEEIKQSVQHEYTYHMFMAPNDPGYGNNWALTKVNAPAAWDISTGNGQTVVAVIDGGFALNHEDLEDQWHANSAETGITQTGDRCWTGAPQNKQSNACDDDNNGYVDDWRGWSFVNRDNNPQAGRINSVGLGVSHGSKVAGIVGATANNETGITALNWNTKIMPLQVLDDDGTGYTSHVTAGIYYAVDNGADVINLSLGGYVSDPALRTAINYAVAHNVVVVAAVGNCGDGMSEECTGVPIGTVAYPAAYPDVIAVGATTATDQRAVFSSYGPSIDVSAPGYNIAPSTSWSASNQTSLYSGNLYGTSFSSPMVASLAALIKSIRPGSSIGDIEALINATASKPTAMNGIQYSNQFGHGIINAGSALSIASALNNAASTTPTLLQTGSYRSEHTTYSALSMSSGCTTTVDSACTIQFTDASGYRRYLPYAVMPESGAVGWSWSSDMLSSTNWSIRARSGDNVSPLPYELFKKG